MNEQARPAVDLSAACACGEVTVRVAGHVRAMFMCSCEDCQKATGTGHSTIAVVNGSDTIVTGPARSFNRTAASGATFTRAFCPACGTPLWGRSSRWPEALMLPVGLFGADTDWYAPTQLIFSRSHRDWDAIAERLPRHETYRAQREDH